MRDRPQANRPRKLDDRGEAHLIALAAAVCSPAPEGPTDPASAGREGGLGLASSMSHEGIRKRLKKTLSSRGRKEWCIPKVSAEFVANMEDVLDLYEEPHDPQRPVVCFDETSTQLLAETRPPLPPRPGRPLRQDYEYRREGTRNLSRWRARHVAVTERRTMQDFAHRMRWLVESLPRSRGGKGRLGQSDTHAGHRCTRLRKPAGVPLHPQARELPEHGGDRGVLSRSCLKQRLSDEEALRREVDALVTEPTTPEPPSTGGRTNQTNRLYPSDR